MTVGSDVDIDVAVVGAGLAGLVCARDLRDGGRTVAVLEARDRVGGRLHSDRVGDTVVEAGGAWVGPTQDAVLDLARELGVATFPTHDKGRRVLEHGGRLTTYRGTVPRLSPPVLADVAQLQARIDRMARRVPPEAPWTAPRAAAWDSVTLESWLRRNAFTRTGRRLLALAAQTVWSVEPAELSLLHTLFYVASAGGLDPLLNVDGGAQQDRLVGGAQGLADGLAARLGDAVRPGSAVTRIERRDDVVRVFYGGASAGTSVTAGRVVVAVPAPVGARIVHEPPLPADTTAVGQRMVMGSVVKCHAVYPTPFWRDRGLSGQAVSVDGPVHVAFDCSPPTGGAGVLLAFLEGAAARHFARAGAVARREAVLGCLARWFGPSAADPEHYLDTDWSAEEFSGGGYAGVFGPGDWRAVGGAIRRPVGRVHWAGSETATRWAGYMDGAVSSGRRAAREILGAPD